MQSISVPQARSRTSAWLALAHFRPAPCPAQPNEPARWAGLVKSDPPAKLDRGGGAPLCWRPNQAGFLVRPEFRICLSRFAIVSAHSKWGRPVVVLATLKRSARIKCLLAGKRPIIIGCGAQRANARARWHRRQHLMIWQSIQFGRHSRYSRSPVRLAGSPKCLFALPLRLRATRPEFGARRVVVRARAYAWPALDRLWPALTNGSSRDFAARAPGKSIPN